MKRIMIVEDEDDILNILEESIREKGFEVKGVNTGEDAISIMEEFRPDIVILDIVLPGISGLEVLKFLKDKYPKIMVILATSKNEIDDIKAGYEYQGDYYITKPYKIDEIFKAIDILSSLGGD